ncbi:unnamed protein product [Bursaphelenchus xylophilus]|uniref:(pine wood nematode) hypothetical protein n=1 Tax=Bursaphelenchus xylophilus TaxID=6326 RepID=A0A1I7SW85_BURXY|nr:unnamed protein product [Bursaphelenchus xylophilus]CAG9098987.1 unnamed protein product [Bursaphelenchus xylophilus]
MNDWPRITRTDFKRSTMRRSGVRKSRTASLKGDIHSSTRNGSIITSTSVPPPNADPNKKQNKEITVRPGLRAMLYGLTMKMEREEANMRKLQKKMHGHDRRALLQPPDHESRAVNRARKTQMQRSTSSGTPSLASLAQNMRKSILKAGQRSLTDDHHLNIPSYNTPPKSVSFHDLVDSRSVIQFALRSLSPKRQASADASTETLVDIHGDKLSFRKSISCFILSPTDLHSFLQLRHEQVIGERVEHVLVIINLSVVYPTVCQDSDPGLGPCAWCRASAFGGSTSNSLVAMLLSNQTTKK